MDATALPNLALYGTIVGALVVIGLTVMGSIAFWKTEKDPAASFSLLIQRANITQMLAVVMIIMAAVGLRLLDKINAEAVVSLLSGIAGYVLGGVNRGQQSLKDDQGAGKPPLQS
jgi:hypothetical protein